MAEIFAERDTTAIFRELVRAEESHKEMLAGLYRDFSGVAGEVDFDSILGKYPPEKTMEGGMRLDDTVAWAEEKGVQDVLELSISLETGSYGRYQVLREG